jgi:hypothetical protein
VWFNFIIIIDCWKILKQNSTLLIN